MTITIIKFDLIEILRKNVIKVQNFNRSVTVSRIIYKMWRFTPFNYNYLLEISLNIRWSKVAV